MTHTRPHYTEWPRGLLIPALFALSTLYALNIPADDWPTYRHDNRRSGVTAEQLDVPALREAWAWQAPHIPQPAWHGPAKWDAFSRNIGLRSMRNFDPVYYVIVVRDALYFAASAEDRVFCLDARSGDSRWTYDVDGPVRMPPAHAAGKVYFGADDGYAYCLNAADGTLVWRCKPSPDDRLLPSDGKLISRWPIRTGVLVAEGKAYFGAALLPWCTSYLCAVDAVTGKADGAGLFWRTFEQVTMEGALLASPSKLYVPQGRSAPMIFDRADGSRKPDLPGAGGVFAVLTPDEKLIHGPNSQKEYFVAMTDAATGDRVASFERGNYMIVTEDRAFVLKDEELLAVDRASKKVLWTAPCDCPYTLILAGDTLLAGGRQQIRAFAASDGSGLGSKSVSGRAYGLVVAHDRLYVSTDNGAIHCFE